MDLFSLTFPKSCAVDPGDRGDHPYRIFLVKEGTGQVVAATGSKAEILRLISDLHELATPEEDFDGKVKEMVRHHQNARMRFGIKCAIEAIRMAIGHEDGLDGTDGEHTIGLLEGVTGINPAEAEVQILDYDALFQAAQGLMRWMTGAVPLYGHDCQWCGDCVQKAKTNFGKAVAKIKAWRMPK
jgi:hypothetical protein